MLKLLRRQVEQIFRLAREASPRECCGLIGGGGDNLAACSLYPLRNVADNPLVTYEAAPEALFAAQRLMRERGEELLAIYHSHPRAAEPSPSDTDVRLAYYPAAIYLIVGLSGAEPVMRAFRISEKERSWKVVEYEIADE
jgi:proteasome lid subunit RPN8/RPN11